MGEPFSCSWQRILGPLGPSTSTIISAWGQHFWTWIKCLFSPLIDDCGSAALDDVQDAEKTLMNNRWCRHMIDGLPDQPPPLLSLSLTVFFSLFFVVFFFFSRKMISDLI